MYQKDEEKLIIRHFRKHCPGFPKGRLIASERPDFILKVSPRRSIGIELTRLANEDDPVNALQEAIKKKAEKLPLYTHMHLSEQWLIIHADDVLADMESGGMELEDFSVKTSFDRVFFVDLFSNRVITVI